MNTEIPVKKNPLQFLNDDSKGLEFFNLNMNRANRKAFLKKHTLIHEKKEIDGHEYLVGKALYKTPNIGSKLGKKLQIVCTASYHVGEVVDGKRITSVVFDVIEITDKKETVHYIGFIYSLEKDEK